MIQDAQCRFTSITSYIDPSGTFGMSSGSSCCKCKRLARSGLKLVGFSNPSLSVSHTATFQDKFKQINTKKDCMKIDTAKWHQAKLWGSSNSIFERLEILIVDHWNLLGKSFNLCFSTSVACASTPSSLGLCSTCINEFKSLLDYYHSQLNNIIIYYYSREIMHPTSSCNSHVEEWKSRLDIHGSAGKHG